LVTTTRFVVTNGAGSITLSLPQSIHTAGTPQFARLGLGAAADGTVPLLSVRTGAGSLAAAIMRNAQTAANNTGSLIDFQANRTGTANTLIAQMGGVITDITAGAYKGSLVFNTADNATPAERMRIDHLGNIGIGTTSPYAKLSVVGQTVSEYFTATSSATSTLPHLTGSFMSGFGLTGCTGSGFLQWSNGLFGCASPSGSSKWDLNSNGTLTSASTTAIATAHSFNATSTTATSTFAGNVLIGGNVVIEGDLEVEGGLLPIILATIATAMAGVAITLTNKRIQPRSSTSATGDITPNLGTANVWQRTAISGTIAINAPTGTPVLGEVIHIILKDNGTSRTLNWNATYKAMGEALKTSTTINKRMEAIAVYDGTDWLTSTVNEV